VGKKVSPPLHLKILLGILNVSFLWTGCQGMEYSFAEFFSSFAKKVILGRNFIVQFVSQIP